MWCISLDALYTVNRNRALGLRVILEVDVEAIAVLMSFLVIICRYLAV